MQDDCCNSRNNVGGVRVNASGSVGLRPAPAGGITQGMMDLIRYAGSLIAAEHVCVMPDGFTTKVTSDARLHLDTRTCGECGQVFASARDAMEGPDRVRRDTLSIAGNVIAFPVGGRAHAGR